MASFSLSFFVIVSFLCFFSSLPLTYISLSYISYLEIHLINISLSRSLSGSLALFFSLSHILLSLSPHLLCLRRVASAGISLSFNTIQAINNLQSTHSGFGFVNRDNVFKVCDQPHPLLVKNIVASCVSGNIDAAYDGKTHALL